MYTHLYIDSETEVSSLYDSGMGEILSSDNIIQYIVVRGTNFSKLKHVRYMCIYIHACMYIGSTCTHAYI